MGRPRAARWSRASACSSTGSRSSRAGRCRSARIDPRSRARCSSARRWSPARSRRSGAFLAHNRQLVAEVAELEHKARRHDVLVDDETIAAFYAERVPEGVAFDRDVRALAHRRRAQRSAPPVHDARGLMRHAAAARHGRRSSRKRSRSPARRCRSSTGSRPGHPLDGLTLTVPLALLNQLDDARSRGSCPAWCARR